jgi:hypothetical protein
MFGDHTCRGVHDRLLGGELGSLVHNGVSSRVPRFLSSDRDRKWGAGHLDAS